MSKLLGELHNGKVIRESFRSRCMHNKFEYDKSLAEVTCGICSEKLNPIWVIEKLSQKENRLALNIEYLEKLAAKADKKNKCKCEHCEKMTSIQRG